MRNVILALVALALACGNVDPAEPAYAEPAEPAGQCTRPPLEVCPADGALVRLFADTECSRPVVRIVDACPAVSSVTDYDGLYVAGEIVEPNTPTGEVALYMHTNCGCVPFVVPSNATYYVGAPRGAD